ncbi:MAG: FHA domain-containing protein [Phycisphaerales bacterium]
MASLIVASGAQQGMYLPLGKGKIVIGRAENLPMQVVDEKASRKHIQIRFEDSDSTFRVVDMGSSNGTMVAGKKITEEATLRDGDEIEIGTTKLLFTTADPKDKPNALEVLKTVGQRGRSTLMR